MVEKHGTDGESIDYRYMPLYRLFVLPSERFSPPQELRFAILLSFSARQKFAKRQQEGYAIHCGSSKHIIWDCILRPPRRPQKQDSASRIQNLAAMMDDADMESEELSGNV